MRNLFIPSRLKVLSGLFTNLSAGWIGAVIILPNFADFTSIKGKLTLTADLIGATVCLLLAFWLEERSERK